MREYLLRMSHNSLVLIEWGNMELIAQENSASPSQEVRALAQELVQAGTEFRLYSFLALAKLKLWILFRLDLSASLPTLRELFGIDSLDSYRRLKSAAGALGMSHGHDYNQVLLSRL
jgi:hypothetical protein